MLKQSSILGPLFQHDEMNFFFKSLVQGKANVLMLGSRWLVSLWTQVGGSGKSVKSFWCITAKDLKPFSDDGDVGLNALGCRADTLGTKCWMKLFFLVNNALIFVVHQDIIRLVVGRLAAGERYFARCFALKLMHIGTRRGYWLHNDLTMYQVRQKYEAKHQPEELRWVEQSQSFKHE